LLAILACGEARGGEHSRSALWPDEQRSHKPKAPQPCGPRPFCPGASLLVRSSIALDTLPRSRLAPGQNGSRQTVFYPTVWWVSWGSNSAPEDAFIATCRSRGQFPSQTVRQCRQ